MGTIFHFNGSEWEKDTLGLGLDTITLASKKEFVLGGVCRYGSEIFAIGSMNDYNTFQNTYYFFRKKDKWEIADSFKVYSDLEEVKWGEGFYLSPDKKLYSFGMGGIFLWTGENWKRIFRKDGIRNMFIKDNGNIFVLTTLGEVFFFDENSWKEIPALHKPELFYTCAWADEDEVFIAGITTGGFPQKTIILYGK